MGEFKSLADYYNPMKEGVETLGVLERQQAISQRGAYMQQEAAKIQQGMDEASSRSQDANMLLGLQKEMVDDPSNSDKADAFYIGTARFHMRHDKERGAEKATEIMAAWGNAKVHGGPMSDWIDKDVAKARAANLNDKNQYAIDKIKAQTSVLEGRLTPYMKMQQSASVMKEMVPRLLSQGRSIQSDITAYDKDRDDLMAKRDEAVDKTALNAAIASNINGRESFVNGLYNKANMGPGAAKQIGQYIGTQIGALRAEAEAAQDQVAASEPGSAPHTLGNIGGAYMTAHADVLEAMHAYHANPNPTTEKALLSAQKSLYKAESAVNGQAESINEAKSKLQNARTGLVQTQEEEKQRKIDKDKAEASVMQEIYARAEKRGVEPDRISSGEINMIAKKHGDLVNPQDIKDRIYGKPVEGRVAAETKFQSEHVDKAITRAEGIAGLKQTFTSDEAGNIKFEPGTATPNKLIKFSDQLRMEAQDRRLGVASQQELLRRADQVQHYARFGWAPEKSGTPLPAEPTAKPQGTATEPPPGMNFEQFKAWRRAHGQ